MATEIIREEVNEKVIEDKKEKLIEVRNLKTYFKTHFGIVRAVDGVSFDIFKGKTLGVAGESGCGKSVTAQSIMRIVPSAGRIVDGEILLRRNETNEVVDLAKLNPKDPLLRSIRGSDIAMIFQEPMNALSPVHTIGAQIIEAIMLHRENVAKEEAREIAIDLLTKVEIAKPRQRIDEYSYQLSGGMRQRAMIAMALSCNPQLLIADEPTTALDVTIQAQIIDLLKQLQREYGMAIMIITHNFGVVAELAEEVVVMYLGKIVESTTVDSLYYNPLHPYTRDLLKAIPYANQGKIEGKRLMAIPGSVPDAYSTPSGCSFYPRCSMMKDGICNVGRVPELIEVEPGHKVRCFLYE